MKALEIKLKLTNFFFLLFTSLNIKKEIEMIQLQSCSCGEKIPFYSPMGIGSLCSDKIKSLYGVGVGRVIQ